MTKEQYEKNMRNLAYSHNKNNTMDHLTDPETTQIAIDKCKDSLHKYQELLDIYNQENNIKGKKQ